MTILNSSNFVGQSLVDFMNSSGIAMVINSGNWQTLVMLGLSLFLLYLAIHKNYEPLLLLPNAIYE